MNHVFRKANHLACFQWKSFKLSACLISCIKTYCMAHVHAARQINIITLYKTRKVTREERILYSVIKCSYFTAVFTGSMYGEFDG